jgi:hypothetical protein
MGRKGIFKGSLGLGPAAREPDYYGWRTVPPTSGVAEAINFQAANGNTIATTSDFLLTAGEVSPVMSELRSRDCGDGIA